MHGILSGVFASIFCILLVLSTWALMRSDAGVKPGAIGIIFVYLAAAIFFALKANGVL